MTARLHPKTVILTIVVVLANVIGNFALTVGMHGAGDALATPLDYIKALFHPWVAAGVCLLLVWMMAQMTLLSWADLSYVLPVTSIGYVLAALAGRVFLQEQISPARWLGVLLIMTGVAIVGRTSHTTTGEAQP